MIVAIFLGTLVVVLFGVCLKQANHIRNLNTEMDETNFGTMQIIDNYEQDFLTYRETIDAQVETITNMSNAMQLMDDDNLKNV